MNADAVSPEELAAVRRTRRHPRRPQFDYLHMRRLVHDIREALDRVECSVQDVLDVYCGSRPYDDLLPSGARCLGLDIEDNPYGVADVVTNEFLPFEDASFDLVTCFEAFHYVEDPERGVAEIRRVLRPAGTALVSVPLVWEYDSRILEHRFTGPELAVLFAGWDDIRVVENGGRMVVWSTLTGTILERVRERIPELWGFGRGARAAFAGIYLFMNLAAGALETLEERHAGGPLTLPMNLLLTARKPLDD
jgi:SAM-dependent methyltransferase